MKKIISLLFVLMLALCTSVVAFAEMGAEPPSSPGSDKMTFTFTKTYKTAKDGTESATYPAEVLKFEVTASGENPDATMITIADQDVTDNPNKIVVTVPSYEKVGKWNYTVYEKTGDTQGVVYDTSKFDVQVFVSYSPDGGNLIAQTTFTTGDGKEGKIDGIVNLYQLGDLTIQKEVSGNLASKTQKFDINVTFTSDKPVRSSITGAAVIESTQWKNDEVTGKYTCTASVSLAHGESATFSNIPAGVEYTVAEDEKHTATDANGSDASTGYKVDYEGAPSGEIPVNGTATVTVTNTKSTELDTGISIDSLPYVMLLGIATMLGVAMLIRRRATNN